MYKIGEILRNEMNQHISEQSKAQQKQSKPVQFEYVEVSKRRKNSKAYKLREDVYASPTSSPSADNDYGKQVKERQAEEDEEKKSVFLPPSTSDIVLYEDALSKDESIQKLESDYVGFGACNEFFVKEDKEKIIAHIDSCITDERWHKHNEVLIDYINSPKNVQIFICTLCVFVAVYFICRWILIKLSRT